MSKETGNAFCKALKADAAMAEELAIFEDGAQEMDEAELDRQQIAGGRLSTPGVCNVTGFWKNNL